MSRRKSLFLWSLFILVGVGAFGFLVFSAEIQKTLEPLSFYEADSHGGKTPQETLTLFVHSLESGKVDEASLYLLSSFRTDGKRRLEMGVKNGTLSRYLELLRKGGAWRTIGKGIAEFEISVDGGQMVVPFTFIEKTGLWKLSEL